MILRGADDLIKRGGRHLLTLILKGSRSKDVLGRSLDQSPAHGFYRNLSAEEVQAQVDWVIRHGLPGDRVRLAIAPAGLHAERMGDREGDRGGRAFSETSTRRCDQARQPPDMSDLKDRNREVIWRLLEKIEASGDRRYIPALEAWEPIDYRKVRARIRDVIRSLRGESTVPEAIVEPLERCAQNREGRPQA